MIKKQFLAYQKTIGAYCSRFVFSTRPVFFFSVRCSHYIVSIFTSRLHLVHLPICQTIFAAIEIRFPILFKFFF